VLCCCVCVYQCVLARLVLTELLMSATCPNGCSGNGDCITIAKLSTDEGLDTDPGTAGDGTGPTYSLWDYDRSYGCRCDIGYTGADCSLRTSRCLC